VAPLRRATLPNVRFSARQASADRSNGCFVCGDWKGEMFSLVDHATHVCRPCVTRVGRAILAMSPPIVARLWPVRPSVREERCGAPPSPDANAEEICAGFKAGVEKNISADDALAHFDLAQAYDEMGLMGDAIREAATALGERAPPAVAGRALNWLFLPGRAEPDALRAIARTLQSE
jgi:hypothetical protein